MEKIREIMQNIRNAKCQLATIPDTDVARINEILELIEGLETELQLLETSQIADEVEPEDYLSLGQDTSDYCYDNEDLEEEFDPSEIN